MMTALPLVITCQHVFEDFGQRFFYVHQVENVMLEGLGVFSFGIKRASELQIGNAKF